MTALAEMQMSNALTRLKVLEKLYLEQKEQIRQLQIACKAALIYISAEDTMSANRVCETLREALANSGVEVLEVK